MSSNPNHIDTSSQFNFFSPDLVGSRYAAVHLAELFGLRSNAVKKFHLKRAKVMQAALARKNLLLRPLPDDVFTRHGFAFRESHLTRGQVLAEYRRPLSHVFFPTTCVVSRRYMAPCGHSAEMGMVGFEGVVGISVLLGDVTASNDAIVHLGGGALCLDTAAARALLKECDVFQAGALAYIRRMIREISQIAACNSLHSIEQRLARWLLQTRQRALNGEFDLTHDLIAQLLSVRRASVTDALNRLSSAGLICTRRSKIRILDWSRLQDTSCECYREVSCLHGGLQDVQGDA